MILVDPPAWSARGRVWSHLASDHSYEELHAFARRVGLHPYGYDGDHYDVPSERYDEVVAAGAVPTTSRDLLHRVSHAGLRFRKRRGERPVAAVPNGLPWLGVAHRLDLVLSGNEPPHEETFGAVVFVRDPRGRMLLVRSARRHAWEGPGGRLEAGEDARTAAVRETQEEAGLALDADALRPVAYERILADVGRAATPEAGRRIDTVLGRLTPTAYVAVFRADVTDPPDLGAVGPEGTALMWAEEERLGSLCGNQPWWPVLDRLLRAEASQSSVPGLR